MAGKFVQTFLPHDIYIELVGVTTVIGITKRDFIVLAIQEKIEKEREVISNKELTRVFRLKLDLKQKPPKKEN